MNFGQYSQVDKLSQHYSFSNVKEFPPHLNVIPFQNEETKKNFAKLTGLFYAKEQGVWLYPHYGEVVFEIKSDQVKLY